MSTPYIGFSNETLAKLPKAKAGDLICCPQCNEGHELVAAEDDDGTEICLFYRCGGKPYLGALNGRLTVGTRADFTGEI